MSPWKKERAKERNRRFLPLGEFHLPRCGTTRVSLFDKLQQLEYNIQALFNALERKYRWKYPPPLLCRWSKRASHGKPCESKQAWELHACS